MSNSAIDALSSLLARVQNAPPRKLPYQAKPHSYEDEIRSLEFARLRTQHEEALMLTYIAKLESVARQSRNLGLDHTSDLDSWLEANPDLYFVSLPTR